MLYWLAPYRVHIQVRGTEYGDLAFGGGVDILVSARFHNLFLQNGLTGLEGFDPVEIVNTKVLMRRFGPPPDYFRVRASISEARLDDVASGVVREVPLSCTECRGGGILRARQIALEPGSWTGEDVFYARGLPGIVLVSARFAQFMRRTSRKEQP